MSGQTQPETALQALAEKLRTDAIAIFGEGQAERDIIEWFYGSLLAAAPANPAERQEQEEVQRLRVALEHCSEVMKDPWRHGEGCISRAINLADAALLASTGQEVES